MLMSYKTVTLLIMIENKRQKFDIYEEFDYN